MNTQATPRECSRAHRGDSRSSARGAAFVEFIIAFVPMFIFFMGIVQLSLLYSAKLVVQHSASRAVRAAIVAEPIPKRECPSGDPGNVDRAFSGSNALPDPLHKKAEAEYGEPSTGTPLLTRVRSAAYLPLAALAPPVFAYPGGAVAQSLVGDFVGPQTARFAAGYFVYNRSHSAVTFRDDAGADYLPDHFPENQMVRVHVSYLQLCVVPVVNRMMCDSLENLGGLNGNDLVQTAKDVPTAVEIIESDGLALNEYTSRVKAEGQKLSEQAQKAVAVYGALLKSEYPQLLLAWKAPSFRFRSIEAEARLPAQFAPYVDLCQH
jgi:hypothetical protein